MRSVHIIIDGKELINGKCTTQVPLAAACLTHPALEHTPEPPLGLAGSIARTFIDSPSSPLLLIASLFIGILDLFFTTRQEDPGSMYP